jgi:hypothetical protein
MATTNETTQPTPTPQPGSAGQEWGEWYQKVPEPLRAQIPPEVLKEIQGGYMRDADYRKKTTELAETRKKYEGRDLDKELGELDQWRGWRKAHWPVVEAKLKEAEERLKGGQPGQPGRDGRANGQPGPVLWGQVTPDDFFEQDRLRQTLGQMEQSFAGAATGAFQRWYQEQEIPRLDKTIQGYVQFYNGLLEMLWPKDKPAFKDVVKEYIARGGEHDFAKIVSEMGSRRSEYEDAGYQRGLEEGKRLAGAAASPPPPATGAPAWAPPGGGARDEAALFQDVMAEVSKRHGPLPI